MVSLSDFLRHFERAERERKTGIMSDGSGSKAICDPVERTSAHPAFPEYPEPERHDPPLHTLTHAGARPYVFDRSTKDIA